MTEIITVLFLSYVLIGFEAIVPGGILGILGFLGLFVAAYFAHSEFGGWFAPAFVFLTGGLGALILVFLEFKWLSRSPLGKKLFLDKVLLDENNNHLDKAAVGAVGVALTDLRPEGLVEIESMQFDACIESGHLPRGSKIVVSGKDDFRIRVRLAED